VQRMAMLCITVAVEINPAICHTAVSWFRGTAVERRSLAGELSLSCARPVADGWPLMWVNRLL